MLIKIEDWYREICIRIYDVFGKFFLKLRKDDE
jgi:hypothetical protein